jgi:hypothetical protein
MTFGSFMLCFLSIVHLGYVKKTLVQALRPLPWRRLRRPSLLIRNARGIAGHVQRLDFTDFQQFRAIILSEMKNEKEFDLLVTPGDTSARGQDGRYICDQPYRHGGDMAGRRAILRARRIFRSCTERHYWQPRGPDLQFGVPRSVRPV